MKKVLIVDDCETIRLQVAGALGRAGFSVVEAEDGVQGLERVADNDFAMAILDVNMPKLGGIEMLERLRANPLYQSIPVVMLTTDAEDSLIERARKAGARGWMIKPIRSEHLVSAVLKITNQ